MSNKVANIGSTGDQDVLCVQYVSDPIASQDIAAQNLKFQIRGMQSLAEDNQCVAIGIRVVSGDGATVRGILLSVTRDLTELAVSSTTPTNRAVSVTTTELLAANIQNGDRIVIEIGVGGNPDSPSTGHHGTLVIGDDSASDLPENDTTTSADNPWVQFANTILFQGSGGSFLLNFI
jgi:hypothetical protein